MVWNSERSPLYQSVRSHNESISTDSGNSAPREEKQRSEPRKPVREQTTNPPKPRGIDRDMLLILMVIFILQSEKSDEGLILALLLTMIL